jgi:transcription-repair coupling factor (superfamily II helicase)
LAAAWSALDDGRIPALEATIGISYATVDLAVADPMVAAMFRLKHQIGDYRGTAGNVVASWSESYLDLATRAVEQGDVFPDADPETVGTLFLEMIIGAHMVAVATDSTDDLAPRMERLWYYLLPSLVPPQKLDYFREFAARRVLRYGA